MQQALASIEPRLNLEAYRKAVAARKAWTSPSSIQAAAGSADAMLCYDSEALPVALLKATTSGAEALALAALVRMRSPARLFRGADARRAPRWSSTSTAAPSRRTRRWT